MAATLETLRRAIETLARDEGEYQLVCARHGDEPVPATALRFESRATARAAACTVRRYRETLREYDPALAVHDIVVTQADDHRYRARREQPATTENRQQTEP